MKLAALALPSHPGPLARIPDPPPMEQVESRAAVRRWAVSGVQPGDSRARRLENRVVALRHLRRGIDPVGDQRKTHVAVRIREVVHFQLVDLFFDVVDSGQERRNRDHRAEVRRYAGRPLEPRQEAWRDHRGDEPVEQCDREVRRRHHAEHAEQNQPRQRDMRRGDAQAEWRGFPRSAARTPPDTREWTRRSARAASEGRAARGSPARARIPAGRLR